MTKNKLCKFTTLSCLLLILLKVALAEDKSPLEPDAAFIFADPVAIYEGQEISKSELDIFLTAVYGYTFNEVENEKRAREIIAMLIRQNNIVDYMKEHNLHENELFIQRLREIEYQVSYELIIAKILETIEEEIEEGVKKEYQEYVNNHDKWEYEIHYIMTDDQEAIDNVIQEYKLQTRDFSKILNDALINTTIKYQGGLLIDWLTPSNMNPIFADAILKLEKGEITQTPIKLNDSFYVLYLNNIREARISSYDEMYQVLRNKVKGKILSERIDSKFASDNFTINKD